MCWQSEAKQHSQAPNPCVMPGQTHTGNQHKHFLLGSRGSRGKGRSLLPPPCLTWHFLIKALNLEGRGRMSSLGKQTSFCPLLKPFCCLHLSLCFWVPYSFPLSVGVCCLVWVSKRCSEPFSWGFKRSIWAGFGTGFQLFLSCEHLCLTHYHRLRSLSESL